MPMLACCSAARCASVASSSQPVNTYGGLSSGTLPSTWSITKNAVPSGLSSGSFQRSLGSGTLLRAATWLITANWPARS